MRKRVVIGIIMGFFISTGGVCALEVPRINVEAGSCTYTKATEAYVKGKIYPADGQIIKLYLADKRSIVSTVRIGSGGGWSAFRIRVPQHVLSGKSTVRLYIMSTQHGNVARSALIPVDMRYVDPPTKETTKATNTTKKATTAKKAAVKKTTAKKKTAKNKIKNTPKQAYLQAASKLKVKKGKPSAAAGRAAAVAWAKMIAADNSFTYGATPYSRHNGCYFCGTNGGKKRHARGTRWANGYKGKKWNKTYCCNPFVHACYAHGARHPKMLKYCRSKQAIDMEKSSYRRMGCFKCIGKPRFSKLIAGDVFVSGSHVWLYCGKGQMAEATSTGGKKRSWSAASIHVTNKAKAKYRNCRYVMRFTGY